MSKVEYVNLKGSISEGSLERLRNDIGELFSYCHETGFLVDSPLMDFLGYCTVESVSKGTE